MADQIEEIKSKLDIVELISEYIQLKPAGANYRALCPFHHEKTPSFLISPEKQIWHCFGCFPKGALVKSDNKFIPIDKIKRGNYVVTGKGNRKKVLFTMKRDYEGELINIQTRKCNENVAMTADHEVYAIRTLNCKQGGRKTRICQSRCSQNCPTKFFTNYKIEKIAAKDLTKNDYLIYPVNEEIKDIKFISLKAYLNRRTTNYGPKIKPIVNKVEINDDFLKLLGYYIAEGSNHRAYARFSLGPREMDFAKEIQKLTKKIFNLESSLHERKKGRTGIEVSCCNSNLANIFENLCGKGSENKRIAPELNFLPPRKQRVLLGAIFKGDGHMSKGGKKCRPGEKQIGTVSRLLADQLKDILLRLGFQPGLSYSRERIDKKGVRHKDSFTVRWREDLKGNYSDFLIDNNIKYWLLPIRNINKSKFRGKVYNLTIKDDHSYVVNHFAVGNCGKGGDIFTFLKEIEGIEFPEVLKILAVKAGVVLSSEEKVSTGQKNKLLEVCDLASRFYQKILESSPVAENARAYLRKRDMAPAMIETFKLGFAPDLSDSLIKFLHNRKINLTDAEAAGLVINGNGGYFDRFRNRIIFPIQDLHGRVVGFTSRILPGAKNEKEVAKYINTPETLIYSKGRVIYGLDKAKVDIKKENIAIVVEGNMDTIACHQSGFKNTVASSGTAFTHTQIMLLKRYADNLLLAFDFDLAGQNAVNRGIELALQEEMEVKIISIPFGKDPDECLKSSPQGKELWEKAVKSAQPIMEYYFLKATNGKDFSLLADIKEAKKIFLLALAKLGDAVEKSFWLKKFSNTINISESDLREELRKVKVVAIESRQKPQEETEPSLIKPGQIIAERALSLLVKFPDLMGCNIESDFINFFIDRDTKKIAEIIIKQYCQDKKGDFSEMVKIAETEGLRHLIESLDLLAEQEYAKLKYPEAEKEFLGLLDKLKRSWAKKKIEELTLKLKEPEFLKNNSEAIALLMEESDNLSKKYLK